MDTSADHDDLLRRMDDATMDPVTGDRFYDGVMASASVETIEEAAALIRSLVEDKARLQAERDQVVAGWGKDAVEVEELRAQVERLRKVGDQLLVCALTTGGVAGRDDGLVAAISGWQEARAALGGDANG